jgi:hypothetical protein
MIHRLYPSMMCKDNSAIEATQEDLVLYAKEEPGDLSIAERLMFGLTLHLRTYVKPTRHGSRRFQSPLR